MHFTTFTPSANVVPLGGAQNATTPGQLSAKVVPKETGVPGKPAHSTMIFVEQTMLGRSVSLIVTVKAQALVLPTASVATQFTVASPLLKAEPLAGVQT